MLLVLCITILTFSAAFWVYSYNRVRKIKPSFIKLKNTFKVLDREQTLLDKKAKTYALLQSNYLREKSELSAIESLLQQHAIGIGTVDSKMYNRVTDFTKLEQMESKLNDIREQAKALVKNKKACICAFSGNMQVNGRKAEATKLINREIKLRIRCFDNEVEAAIALASWNNINRLIERINRVFLDINNKGKIIQTQLQAQYRDLKVAELKLSYEISQLKNDIKEAEREERSAQREAEREEGKIKAAAEQAQKDRARMEALVQKELLKYESATEEQRAILALHQAELAILKERENRATSMAQLTRAGYVYIISNNMAFGPEIIKIGMTRRVDPYERVHELGDASVPDTFDVHAFFYCEDAPALESELHRTFSDKRINLVNKRKEFFNIPFNEAIEAVINSSIRSDRIV